MGCDRECRQMVDRLGATSQTRENPLVAIPEFSDAVEHGAELAPDDQQKWVSGISEISEIRQKRMALGGAHSWGIGVTTMHDVVEGPALSAVEGPAM